MSSSDIAELAGVSRGAVSNWRKRDTDFPKPVAGTPAKPLFSSAQVQDWLAARGGTATSSSATPGGELEVWSALNMLDGLFEADAAVDLLLALAVARKTGAPAPESWPGVLQSKFLMVERAVRRAEVSNLARVVDYALERLGRAEGRSGGTYGRVGSRATELLANLAASRPGGVLYDPACGVAAALLEAVQRGSNPDRVVGHDSSDPVLAYAAQRATLHGVPVEFTCTDVLAEDVDPALQADTIVLEPPLAMRMDAPSRLADPRFTFGAPPAMFADTAWLQHAIAHLADDGRAYVLTPLGVLFRGRDEAGIRGQLINQGCVEAVVGLPSRFLANTAIPLALWVLRRPVTDGVVGPVLVIDASEAEAPERHLAQWLAAPEARADIPHAEVPITDLLAAGAVLTPRRWVARLDRRPGAVAQRYGDGWSEVAQAMIALDRALRSFAHPERTSRPRVLTVGELIAQGALDLRPGQARARYMDAPAVLRARLVTSDDVRAGTLRPSPVNGPVEDYPGRTLAGDVLVTTRSAVYARLDEVGGHLPTTGVYRLRSLNPEVLSPGYLASVLTGSWNERLEAGSSVLQVSVKELEVPIVPIDEQHSLERAVQSARQIHAQAARVAAGASAVAEGLLDGVRYHVELGSPATSEPTRGGDS